MANLKKYDEIYWQRRISEGFYTLSLGATAYGLCFFVDFIATLSTDSK
jgi:hypothetical protein